NGMDAEKANTILGMQLYRYAKSELQKVLDNITQTKQKIQDLEKMINSETDIREYIKNQLLEIKSQHVTPRKTALEQRIVVEDVDLELMLPEFDNKNLKITINNNSVRVSDNGKVIKKSNDVISIVCVNGMVFNAC